MGRHAGSRMEVGKLPMDNRKHVITIILWIGTVLLGVGGAYIFADPTKGQTADFFDQFEKANEEFKRQNVVRDQERQALHARLMDQCLEERAEYECILKVGQAVQVAIP